MRLYEDPARHQKRFTKNRGSIIHIVMLDDDELAALRSSLVRESSYWSSKVRRSQGTDGEQELTRARSMLTDLRPDQDREIQR